MTSHMERITATLSESRERRAYYDGFQDGALVTLASSLDVSLPADAPQEHTLMGRRFKVSIEWIDEPPNMEIAKKMVVRSIERMRSR